MASIVFTVLSFIIALIISTVIIYVIAKLLGETEGITTAFIAALIGTVVYTIIYYLLPNNLLDSGNHCWNRVAAGTAETVHNRLAQIPVNCSCRLDSDNHCWMVPAYAHRSDVKDNKQSFSIFTPEKRRRLRS